MILKDDFITFQFHYQSTFLESSGSGDSEVEMPEAYTCGEDGCIFFVGHDYYD